MPSTQQRAVATLEDYLDAVRRRKWIVLLGLLIGLGAATVHTGDRVAYYEASAEVLLNPSPLGRTDGGFSNPNLEREAKVIVGAQTERTARSRLGLPSATELGDSVSSSFIPQSDVITVTASASDPERAADLVNTYAAVYVEQRVAEQSELFSVLIDGLQADIDAAKARVAADQGEIARIDQEIGAVRALASNDEKDLQLATLNTDRNFYQNLISSDQALILNADSKQSDLERSRDGAQPPAKILVAADVPDDATGLPDWAFLAAGLFGGLALGIVGAFLRERLDRKASSARDVEVALGGRVLGAVPRFGVRRHRGRRALIMANGRRAASVQRAREAYRRLRASIQFVARSEGARAVVVTSTKPLEGKSTTAANLAVSLALGGTRTALVSADLRRPSLEALFGLRNEGGLSTYLTGKTDIVHTEMLDGIEALTIVPAGPEVPSPGELLGSARFARLIALLLENYEAVIIDTPPLGAAADALAAAESAHGVLVVVDGNRTDVDELLAIRRELDRSGVTFLGAILNRSATKRRLPFRGRRYGYYGGPAPTHLGVAADDGGIPVLAGTVAGQTGAAERTSAPGEPSDSLDTADFPNGPDQVARLDTVGATGTNRGSVPGTGHHRA